MNRDTLRVHAPTSVVFLCGGVTDDINAPSETPITLRDAFLRIAAAGSLLEYSIVLAEKAVPLTAEAGYHDLLSFESDIAQVVGLILLFAESPGSLAELGAFAALKTVAPSVMAVVDDYYYGKSSFIRNGPIKHLEHEYGDEWVLVLDRAEVGIGEDSSLQSLDLKMFAQSVIPPVEARLKALPKWLKFDPANDGHVILLITGLCQEFGALKKGEIKEYLENFGVIDPRMDNFLYCAELLKWIARTKKGNNTFFVSLPGDSAINFNFTHDAKVKDHVRWRSDIREFWKVNDKPRARALIEGAQE